MKLYELTAQIQNARLAVIREAVQSEIGVLTESKNIQQLFLHEKFITNLSNMGNAPITAYNVFEGMEDEVAKLDITDIGLLNFSLANSKLGANVITFSLPAGWTCPYAKKCLQKADRYREVDPSKVGTTHTSRRTGKEMDYIGEPTKLRNGPDMEFGCYAAAQERQYDAVRENRWHNYDLLIEAGKKGGSKAQADLIIKSLNYFMNETPRNAASTVRIHESGDFYNGEYLDAWIDVAKRMPKIKFYAYTKSLPLVKKTKDVSDAIPNLAINLSAGGQRDRDLDKLDIKQADVFETPEEVLKTGMFIDLDDSLAQEKGGKNFNFALLVHGPQKAGRMTQLAKRNETFMAFWKYRKILNDFFDKPMNNMWTIEEANTAKATINKYLENKAIRTEKKLSIGDLKFKRKLLNYVIKYKKYKFPSELSDTVPLKYR